MISRIINWIINRLFEYAEDLRAALEARGLEIRSKSDDRH
jgi:energy-coupling factor transporter transmembrane protein EcfT